MCPDELEYCSNIIFLDLYRAVPSMLEMTTMVVKKREWRATPSVIDEILRNFQEI